MAGVAGAVESLLPRGGRAIKRLRLLRDEDYTARQVIESVSGDVDRGKVAVGGLELVVRASGSGVPAGPSNRQARRLTHLLAAAAAASPNLLPSLTKLSLVNLQFTAPAFAGLLRSCAHLEALDLYQSDAGLGEVLEIEHAQLRHLAIHDCMHVQKGAGGFGAEAGARRRRGLVLPFRSHLVRRRPAPQGAPLEEQSREFIYLCRNSRY